MQYCGVWVVHSFRQNSAAVQSSWQDFSITDFSRWYRYFYDVVSPAGICPLKADSQGRCYPEADRPNKFQTHGALIGGPKTPTDAGNPERVAYSLEGWNDWRMDWVGSEQTLDYNAMYTVTLAAAIELPSSFWTAPCGGELFLMASLRRNWHCTTTGQRVST